jgi:Sporulation and spore germination
MISRPLVIGALVMLAVALAMGSYAWHMRGISRNELPVTAHQSAVAPPVLGTSEQVTLYVAYDDIGVLRAERFRIPLPEAPQQRAEELLRTLLNVYLDKSSPHPLGTGSEVRNVYLVDPGLAVIDLNSAFANGHRSGILVEELTVASLVATLSANIPGISRVKILVDGKERDTLAGHADLTNFYNAAAVNQLAAQLQTAE